MIIVYNTRLEIKTKIQMQWTVCLWKPRTNYRLYSLMDHLSTNSVVTADAIKIWTLGDPVLFKVYCFIRTGWRDIVNISPDMKPYVQRLDELSSEAECVLWGSRIIVMPQWQKPILQELHSTHPGMNKMKSLSRGYVWWPHLDEDIDSVVRKYSVCQELI